MPVVEAYVRGPLYSRTIPIPPGAVLRKSDLIDLLRAMDQSFTDASRSMDWQIEWATETVRGHEISDLDDTLRGATSNPVGFHASCEADGPPAKQRGLDLSLTQKPAIHIAAADNTWLKQQGAVFELEVARRFPAPRTWPEWAQPAALFATVILGASAAAIVLSGRTLEGPLLAAFVAYLVALAFLSAYVQARFRPPSGFTILVIESPRTAWYDTGFARGFLACAAIISLLIALWQVVVAVISKP